MLDATHRRWLTLLNLVMFGVHAGMTGVVLAFANMRMEVTTYETTLHFEQRAEGGFDLIPAYRPFVQPLQLAWGVVFFFLVSAVAHLGNGWLWRDTYFCYLARAQCPMRWVEYALSASTMMIIIAYTAGVRGYIDLVYIFGLTATTMSFGWLNEVINRPEPLSDAWQLPLLARVQAHLIGYVPLVVAWFGVLYAFARASDGCRRPPDFVYAIVAAEAVLFFSFGGPQAYQALARPSRYVHGEYAYQVLSLVAKATLGAVMLANVLAYDSFESAVEPSSGEDGDCGSGF